VDGTIRKLRKADVRALKASWTCRDVIFTCSNGWTIEKLPHADHLTEGTLMGHCMGGKDARGHTETELSLREPDGTPHATIGCYWRYTDEVIPYGIHNLGGRCNRFPKAEYVALINELVFALGEDKIVRECNSWGTDTDDEYHVQHVVTDETYMDNDGQGAQYRDAAWRRRRGVEHASAR
jgi:hypothetical protein